jgi:predicted outer membrane lipoprotein
MDNGILGVVIAGGFSIVVALIHKLIKDNETDHGIVRDSLDRIENKIDRHVENHDS